MRKLVKKLALVLALVLAFACFAPASAQAAEARRSWNFAVGEFKPTYEMEVGDTFTFEALDNGDAIDASKYTVAYYSKNADALALNKETGEAEALAAAEDVKIAAVVTNMVTGNFVKIWAFVDIAAKEVVEPEVTPTEEITPTVEVTPEPTPTEVALAAVSTRQVSKDTFAVTFNKDLEANADAKAATKVKLTQKDSAIKYSTVIKSVAISGKDLVVTLYNSPAKDQTVYITYNGLEAPAHKVAIGDKAASAEITTTEVIYNTFAEVEGILYDANGVELYKGKLSGTDLVSLEIAEDTYDAFIVGANQIYFSTDGKAFCVNVKNKDNTVIGGAYVASVKTVTTTASSYEKFALGAKNLVPGSDAFKKLSFVTNGVLSICVDEEFQLYGMRTNSSTVLGETKTTDEYTVSHADYTYESTDTSVLLVNLTTGVLIPIKEGTADVIVKDVDGKVVGASSIVVKAARKLSYIVVTLDKTTASKATAANEKITAAVVGYDQYDAALPANKVVANAADVAIKFTSSKSISNVTKSFDSENKKINVVFSCAGADAAGYTVEFKCGDFKATKGFTVVDPKGNALAYGLAGAKNLTAKLNKDNTLTLTAQSYGVGNALLNASEVITGIVSADDLKAPNNYAPGKLYVNVTKNSGSNPASTAIVDGKLAFSFKTAANDITAGQYTVTLYQCVELSAGTNRFIPKTTVTFTVTSGKDALTVKANKDTVAVDYDAVVSGSAFSFAVESVVSGGAIENYATKTIFDALKMYVGEVKDGKELKASDEGFTKIAIEGFADGSATIVVSKVTVVKGNATYTCTLSAADRPVIKFTGYAD